MSDLRSPPTTLYFLLFSSASMTGSDYFSIRLYHGGKLQGFMQKSYVGGDIDFVDLCDPDKMSVEELKTMARELGHTEELLFFYVEPGSTLDTGLRVLRSDAAIVKMCELVTDDKILDLYCIKDIKPHKLATEVMQKKGKQVVVEEGSDHDWEPDGNESDSSHDEKDRFTDDDDYCVDEEMLNGEQNEEDTKGDKMASQQTTKSQLDEAFVGASQVTQNSNAEAETTGRRMGVKVCARKKGKSKKKVTTRKKKAESPPRQNEEQEGEENQFDILLDNAVVDELQNEEHGYSDDEGEEVEPHYVDFNAERDMRQPQFQLLMRFSSSREFKEAIRNYSIWQRKPLRFISNERHRVRVKCAEGCPWVCYASVVKSSGTNDFIVKTLVDKHENCNHAYKNRHLTAKWIAARYEERVRANMNIPVREIRQTIDEDHEASITPSVAYRARNLARESITGSAALQYAKIWEYCDEIKRTHPNSTMVVEHTPFRMESGLPRFMRLYCCLGPLKEGFKLCRPIIGLDGCHIKGPYRGQLLTAIGVDPNNGWWPIAWVVVEKEATIQWKWFIELLKQDIEIENQFHYTFISDQQKGLDRALSEVLPNSEHRYCVQHMYRNFKKKHPGKVLKDMIWAIARSSNMEMFNNAMKVLEEYDMKLMGGLKRHLNHPIGPKRKRTMEAQGASENSQPNLPASSSQTLIPAPPLRRSPRKLSKLTDGDKSRINANCAWLGKPIPYTVGGWKR